MSRHVDYLAACVVALEAKAEITFTVYDSFDHVGKRSLDGAIELDLKDRFPASDIGGDPHLEGYSIVGVITKRTDRSDPRVTRKAVDDQLDYLKEVLHLVPGYSGVKEFRVAFNPEPMESDGIEYTWAAYTWQTYEG